MATRNLHLFRSLQHFIAEKCFIDAEEVKAKLHQCFASKSFALRFPIFTKFEFLFGFILSHAKGANLKDKFILHVLHIKLIERELQVVRRPSFRMFVWQEKHDNFCMFFSAKIARIVYPFGLYLISLPK